MPSLGCLTGLRQLTLTFDTDDDQPITNSLLHQVAQLQSLTQLRLCGIDDDCDLELLPVQLQDLEVVSYLHQPMLTVVCHLTRLQRVELEWSCFDTAEDIQQLQDMAPQLNQLQHVSLADPSVGSLIGTAPIWKQIPNLRSLELDMETDHMELDDFQQLMQQLAEAKSLEHLTVGIPLEGVIYMPYDADHLTSLVNLRSLRFNLCEFTPAGVQQLAQLNALTSN